MRVTVIQNIKQFRVTSNQVKKVMRVQVNQVQNSYRITISPLGKQGLKGDKGDTGAFTEFPLTVTENGQTIFNIATIPNKSYLMIGGLEYYENDSYTISMIGLNASLTWLNEFELTTTDKLILKKI